MFAVAACLIAVTLGVAMTWALAGLRNRASVDAAFEPEIATRNVSIMGGLAGFAVTGIVLLVGQTANLERAGADFTNVLAIFVVAYVGLLASSVQLANVADRVRAPFDLAAAQYAVATISQYYIYVGWLALPPLFKAFGLSQISELSGWLVTLAMFVGYPLLATTLIRSGFARPASAIGLAVIGVLAAGAYVVAVRLFVPGGRVEDGTLVMTVAAFVPGALMHAVTSTLPALATRARFVAILTERFHLVVLAYAVSVTVILQLLLVSVLGLA